MSPIGWLLFALLFFFVLFAALFVPHLRTRRTDPGPRSAQLDRLAEDQRFRDRAADVELRLLELHREIDARTENKLQLLRALVEEAEARIAELRELLDREGRG